MLEGIVERESNVFLNQFKSRFRRAFFPLMISSSLLLNSCTSTSQHYDYREEPRTRTKDEKILKEEILDKGVRYNIQEEKISFDNVNAVTIPVIEEKYEEKRIEKRLIETARFDEYKTIRTTTSSAGASILVGTVLGLGGALIGRLIEVNQKEKESHANEWGGAVIGFGVGFLIGVLAGNVNDDLKIKNTQEYRTGDSEIRTLNDRFVVENKNFIIFSGPARNLKLGLTSEHIDFKDNSVYTNNEGIASAVIIKLPYDYAFSDVVLKKKIRSWDGIKKFSSPLQDILLDEIDDKIYNNSLEMNVETLSEKKKGVSNDSETVRIPVKYVKKDDVYHIANSLLEMERMRKKEERDFYIREIVDKFNVNIREFTVYVEDKESHARIPAEVTITGYAPSPQSFLDDYFNGDELRQAVSLADNYPFEGRIVTKPAYNGETIFYLYIPSKYHIKVVNPGYHFVESDFKLDASDLDRKVRMVEKEDKIKISLFAGSGGIE